MAKSHTLSSLTLAALSATTATAAIPVRWTVDTFRVKPLVYDCYHGETLDLAAALTAYGDPINLSGKTARLYWQTNGMDSAYWSTNATIASAASVTNILAATFSGAYDTGAPSVSGFIGVEGENYRAAFTLNFRPSPGFAPAHLPLPTRVLDFATTAVANPDASPFMVKGGSGGIDALTATNISRTVTSNIVTKAYVESLGIAGGGITTNDVDGILASSNLVDVAAATAMTNALRGEVSAGYVPLVEDVDGNKTAVTICERREGDVGEYSFVNGYNCKAPSPSSHAEGIGTTASGECSHAEGAHTTAYGYYSHAEGESTTASGECSHADGRETTAYGDYSHADGRETTAYGDYSHADGVNSKTRSTDIYSFAWSGDARYDEEEEPIYYQSHGVGTFNINPVGGTSGFWIGETNFAGHLSAFAPKLTGRTYDFANGSNFVRRVYEALTNVIQTLGGSVTNAPTFN